MPAVALNATPAMPGRASSPSGLVARIDLIVALLALPLFIATDLPLSGWAVGAGAWLAGSGLKLIADRRARRAISAGARHAAMGATAFGLLGRVWFVAAVILIAGAIDRDTGLAAAVFVVVLFTLEMGARAITHMLGADAAEAEARQASSAMDRSPEDNS